MHTKCMDTKQTCNHQVQLTRKQKSLMHDAANHTGHPSPTVPGQHGCNNEATSTHMHMWLGMGGPGLSPGKCKTCPSLGGIVQERGGTAAPQCKGVKQAGSRIRWYVLWVLLDHPGSRGEINTCKTPSHAKNHTSNHHKTRLPPHLPAAGRAKQNPDERESTPAPRLCEGLGRGSRWDAPGSPKRGAGQAPAATTPEGITANQ